MKFRGGSFSGVDDDSAENKTIIGFLNATWGFFSDVGGIVEIWVSMRDHA